MKCIKSRLLAQGELFSKIGTFLGGSCNRWGCQGLWSVRRCACPRAASGPNGGMCDCWLMFVKKPFSSLPQYLGAGRRGLLVHSFLLLRFEAMSFVYLWTQYYACFSLYYPWILSFQHKIAAPVWKHPHILWPCHPQPSSGNGHHSRQSSCDGWSPPPQSTSTSLSLAA
jgi:hypothetical protein